MKDEEKIVSVRDWVEPAHPTIIKLRDDLVSIYNLIREKYQTEIDNAFDRVSRQIGFVVTTTIPVVLEVDKGGKIKRFSMGAEHLKDTLFEKELSAVLKPLINDDPVPIRTAGIFKLNLLWFDALKLKLRTDWMEPAHRPRGPPWDERIRGIGAKFVGIKQCAWCEPAHWFDPGILIATEEAVMIDAIDEVYPELKLLDRVTSSRESLRKVGPGVKEPAHFRQIEGGLEAENTKNVLSELASVLKRYGY